MFSRCASYPGRSYGFQRPDNGAATPLSEPATRHHSRAPPRPARRDPRKRTRMYTQLPRGAHRNGVRTRRRPQPSMIVAIIALVAATGGTATALPGRNTVDRNDVAKNAIRSKAIKDGHVASVDLADGAVTGVKIADGTI